VHKNQETDRGNQVGFRNGDIECASAVTVAESSLMNTSLLSQYLSTGAATFYTIFLGGPVR
jgi:hypothetical protein